MSFYDDLKEALTECVEHAKGNIQLPTRVYHPPSNFAVAIKRAGIAKPEPIDIIRIKEHEAWPMLPHEEAEFRAAKLEAQMEKSMSLDYKYAAREFITANLLPVNVVDELAKLLQDVYEEAYDDGHDEGWDMGFEAGSCECDK